MGESTLAKEFPYRLLAEGTGDFNDANIVGEGGFGVVYRASIRDPVHGSILPSAVKKLTHDYLKAQIHWENEINILKRLSHSCLVKFHGYCSEGGSLYLVHEFVRGGTLQDNLHGGRKITKKNFNWAKRVDIAHQISLGVKYLHDNNVIHRDLKGANILMDDDLNVKIADFGSVKLLNDDATHAITRRVGTKVYMDPEYVTTGRVRRESDIFSLGVILLELLTGRPAEWKGERRCPERLSKWAQENINDDFNWRNVLNRQILEEIDTDTKIIGVRRLTILAKQCVLRSFQGRPSIGDIVATLSQIRDENLGCSELIGAK